MQLYFIRHAQSENNQLYAETGSYLGPKRREDPDLTPLGRQQASKLAQFLRDHGHPDTRLEWGYDTQNLGGFALTHLYCSMMVRAVATGSIVSRALGLPLVAWEELHEVGGIHQRDEQTGDPISLPGKNRTYFEEHYPELILPSSLGEGGWWACRPFEEREKRPLRARRLLDDLLARHGDSEDRVAVVSHGGIYGYLLRSLYDLQDGYWFNLNNAAITRIDFLEDRTTVGYMNRLDFLPYDLVT
jgi:2,3-bisphosphoglycerate-dependent phosphoglycerate mutase